MKERLAGWLAVLIVIPPGPACLGEENPQLGGRLPQSDANVVLWWALSSAAKILPDAAPLEQPTAAVQMRCARNEYESVQVLVRPGRPLLKLSAEVGSLIAPCRNVIASTDIEILKAVYLNVTAPTDIRGLLGSWPDPLLPFHGTADLEAGINHAFWIRVHVPRTVSAGAYHGLLRMRAEGWSGDIPLDLTVYNFALPDKMTCQTAFGFSPEEVFRYQALKTETSKRQVLEKYWADLAAHHVSPYDPAPLDPIKVTWPDVHPPKALHGGDLQPRQRAELRLPAEQLRPSLDFAAWDKAMTKAVDVYHFNSFQVPIPGLGGGNFYEVVQPGLLGFPEDAPEYPLLLGSYCRQLEAHLKAKGWLNQAFVYWFDEPKEDQYPFLQNGFNKLKRFCPDIPRMITKLVEPGLIDGPNLWCPISDQFQPELSAERQKLGERFWWYVCTYPKAPYAGLFLDHSAPDMRVWLWQTYQRNIEGILVWQCNYWNSPTAYPDPNNPQNPYEDPMSWKDGGGTPVGKKRPYGNGDGRFFYPPIAAASGNPGAPVLDGPVDSIRWEQLRDGIEDYEYLTMLRQELNQRRATLKPETVHAYEELLKVPETITRNMKEFTLDGGPIEIRRHQIARALEALSP